MEPLKRRSVRWYQPTACAISHGELCRKMLLNSEALLEKLVLGSSRSQQNCPARGPCAARWRTARGCARRATQRAAALGGEFIACPWREWAVLTDKKTIPDDLLVREFTMVSEVGGNA